MNLYTDGGQFQEIRENRQVIFEGNMLTLCRDTVRLPDGREAQREVVLHPGAVAILAITDEDEVLLVRQYRHALEALSIELPAGKLERLEDPDVAADRELAEETGYTAGEMERVLSFYSTPGFSDERLFLYKATHLTVGEQNLDEDEFMDVLAVNRTDVAEAIAQGAIRDAKTLIGLLWWLQQR